MVCQICGAKSGFNPLCKNCFNLKDEGKITKCEDCGIWKKDVNEIKNDLKDVIEEIIKTNQNNP